MNDTRSIRSSIERYRSLRLHRDDSFHRRLIELQEWKLAKALSSFAPHLEDKTRGELVHYYLSEVLVGVHLRELKKTRHINKIMEKLLTGTDMVTVALEFNALTFEINEKLSEQIYERMGVEHVDVCCYVEACHQADVFRDMERQFELFEKFSVFLDEAVTDRVVITGFKVARIPARLVGLKRLYRLAKDGFKLARTSTDPQRILLDIVAHERQVLTNIRDRSEKIFFQADVSE